MVKTPAEFVAFADSGIGKTFPAKINVSISSPDENPDAVKLTESPGCPEDGLIERLPIVYALKKSPPARPVKPPKPSNLFWKELSKNACFPITSKSAYKTCCCEFAELVTITSIHFGPGGTEVSVLYVILVDAVPPSEGDNVALNGAFPKSESLLQEFPKQA